MRPSCWLQDFQHDAPGANDDGSGVAAVIEAARVLSHRKFAATIVYAVLSGEEQGLYGGKLLAKTAKEKGWLVEAVLNNDIIGNVEGTDGRIDRDHFRLFSEGVRVGESDAKADLRSENGIAYGDVPAGVDFPYLAAMTRVNAVSLADLAWAPAPPPSVKIEGAVSSDTTLSWPESAGASGYRARSRATDDDNWEKQIFLTGNNIVLKGEVIDDWAFGVEAVSPKGFVSPTKFADGK